jgi:cardiolipin synthase
MRTQIVIAVAITLLVVVVAMNLATPEKKIERRIPHRFPVDDPLFRRELSVLLGPAITAGNSVTALQNGDEIFPAMLSAIRAARVSITLETYIYWSGSIGVEFAEALSAKAREGVPVSMIIDWVGSAKMEQALLDRMRDAGVRLHRYRPLRWYNIGRLNNRTHRKLLVIDGRIAFTGGVGIADQWLGHAQDAEHWRDTHFRVEGPVVAQFQAAFNDNWIKTTGELAGGAPYFPPLERAGGMDAHLFMASPAGGSESMHMMYLLAVAAAEHTIDLAAAYFVPDDLLVSAMRAARGRGVRVRVLVPGPHIDSETVRFASKSIWGTLLEAGVEIHVYQPTMLHTKLLVVDSLLVSVGSTNFDIRSFRLNDEASLNVYDRDFAIAMTTVFERDLTRAQQYTLERWKRRPLREKLAETLLLPFKSQL